MNLHILSRKSVYPIPDPYTRVRIPESQAKNKPKDYD